MRVRKLLDRVCGWGTILLLTMTAAVLAAEDEQQEYPDAVRRLEQVRQTLLSQALDEGVSLFSHGYIDSSGRLIESAYFRTGTQARGLRVASYLEEMTEPAFNDSSVLPPVMQAGQACNSRFASSVVVNPVAVSISASVAGVNRSNLAALLMEPLMSSLQTNTRLIPVAANPVASRLSNYDRYMTGVVAPQAEIVVDSELRLVRRRTGQIGNLRAFANQGVAAARDALTELTTPAAYYPSWALELRITLTDSVEHESLLTFMRTYRIPGQPARLDQPPGLGALPQQIGGDVLDFARQLENLEHCALARLRLAADEQGDPSVRSIGRGVAHGVRTGMRFLMSSQDLNHAPDVLADELLSGLAIGEVIEVSAEEARLRVIAGNSDLDALQFAVPF